MGFFVRENTKMQIITNVYHGDNKEQLKLSSDNFVDLIVTSPPYADQRKDTYGGIHPDEYSTPFQVMEFSTA